MGQPEVSQLRIGTLVENGIKLRHDFALTQDEESQVEEAMQG